MSKFFARKVCVLISRGSSKMGSGSDAGLNGGNPNGLIIESGSDLRLFW